MNEERENLSQQFHPKYLLAIMNSTFAKEWLANWIKKRDMKKKIGVLWNFLNEIYKDKFPNEPCFKDLERKLRHLADWYCITRNEAAHPDREAVLPTQSEMELSIRQFRRFVISIFQIIDLLQSKSQTQVANP